MIGPTDRVEDVVVVVVFSCCIVWSRFSSSSFASYCSNLSLLPRRWAHNYQSNTISLPSSPSLPSAIANQIIEIYFLFSNICIYILRSSANLHYWALLRMLLVRFILVDRLAPISSSRSRSLSLDPSSFPPLSFPAMNIISPCLLPLIEFIYYPHRRLNLLSFPVPPIITNFRFCFPRCTRTPK